MYQNYKDDQYRQMQPSSYSEVTKPEGTTLYQPRETKVKYQKPSSKVIQNVKVLK